MESKEPWYPFEDEEDELDEYLNTFTLSVDASLRESFRQDAFLKSAVAEALVDKIFCGIIYDPDEDDGFF